MKRTTLRSIKPVVSSLTLPHTWLRIPESLNSSEKVIPERPSRRDARTSCWLLPMLETMPRPVITARFIQYLCKSHYSKFRVAQ